MIVVQVLGLWLALVIHLPLGWLSSLRLLPLAALKGHVSWPKPNLQQGRKANIDNLDKERVTLTSKTLRVGFGALWMRM